MLSKCASLTRVRTPIGFVRDGDGSRRPGATYESRRLRVPILFPRCSTQNSVLAPGQNDPAFISAYRLHLQSRREHGLNCSPGLRLSRTSSPESKQPNYLLRCNAAPAATRLSLSPLGGPDNCSKTRGFPSLTHVRFGLHNLLEKKRCGALLSTPWHRNAVTEITHACD